jgi:hypothetical protein
MAHHGPRRRHVCDTGSTAAADGWGSWWVSQFTPTHRGRSWRCCRHPGAGGVCELYHHCPAAVGRQSESRLTCAGAARGLLAGDGSNRPLRRLSSRSDTRPTAWVGHERRPHPMGHPSRPRSPRAASAVQSQYRTPRTCSSIAASTGTATQVRTTCAPIS